MNLPPFLAARVRGLFMIVALVCMLGVLCAGIRAQAERPPLTKNVPVWDFQNKGDGSSYDFDAPPKGIFHTIEFAENFEQELGFRRTHDFIPVNPTEQFRSDSEPVFIVFTLHKHYDSFMEHWPQVKLVIVRLDDVEDGLDQVILNVSHPADKEGIRR